MCLKVAHRDKSEWPLHLHNASTGRRNNNNSVILIFTLSFELGLNRGLLFGMGVGKPQKTRLFETLLRGFAELYVISRLGLFEVEGSSLVQDS